MQPRQKLCNECKQTKPLTEFYKTKSKGVRIYKSFCKVCHKTKAKVFRDKRSQQDIDRVTQMQPLHLDLRKGFIHDNARH